MLFCLTKSLLVVYFPTLREDKFPTSFNIPIEMMFSPTLIGMCWKSKKFRIRKVDVLKMIVPNAVGIK